MSIARLGFTLTLSVVTAFCTLSNAGAQDFPSRPIRLVTSEIGGSADQTARFVAPALAERLGQSVVVDNHGGSSYVPGQVTLQAPPNGYTLFINGSSFWLAPFLEEDLPYDVVRDFAPITMVSSGPSILVVNPASPAKSIRELVALAKAKPGALNYGSGSTGSINHLSGELFKMLAGVDIVRVPYKGTSPALASLMAGDIQMMFPNAGAASALIKAGKLRALGITSAQESPLFPGIPTIASGGLQGYEAMGSFAMFVHGKTPPALIARLNQDMVQTLNRADVRKRFTDLGIEAVGNSPSQLAASIQSDMNLLGKLIKTMGIRAD